MRSLYSIPEQPNETYTLQVGKQLSTGAYHQLSIREFGNPDGIPAVVFHGGPGAGCRDYHAGYFDPKKYRTFLIDQRGAGQSTPKGCMEENNTANLVEDMETARKFLNVDKWVIVGGSWGSTLGLLYAEKYPQAVHALVLRGVFLAREEDTVDFLHKESPAARLNSTKWKAFTDKVAQLLGQAKLTVSDPDTKDYYIRALYALLNQSDAGIRREAAGAMAFWEESNATLEVDDKLLSWAVGADGENMGLTEITFMQNRWFMSDNKIVTDIAAIREAKIPVHIIHGEHDRICLPGNADKLEELLPNQVTRYRTVAGHSGGEPANKAAIVAATDALAVQLTPREVIEANKSWFRLGVFGAAAVTAAGVVVAALSAKGPAR